MTERAIDDLTRNAFVDGKLDPSQRQAMHAYLRAHPEEAQKLAGWQSDAEQLRNLAYQESQPPNPNLTPAAIRARVRTRSRRRLAMAASLVMTLAIGSVMGWSAHDTVVAANRALPMQDAMQAYRMFASTDAPQPDVRADADDLQRWLDSRFVHAERLPDLSASGFQPISARLMTTDQGPAAIVIYANADQRATFYIRPPGPDGHSLRQGSRRDGELRVRYWSGQGYNYAVVTSHAVNDQTTSLSGTVRS